MVLKNIYLYINLTLKHLKKLVQNLIKRCECTIILLSGQLAAIVGNNLLGGKNNLLGGQLPTQLTCYFHPCSSVLGA